MQIRTDDLVQVITGDDKGTRAKVLLALPSENKIIVEGVNRVYKHVRPNARNRQGGRLSKEMPINASNVLLVCPRCSRGVRIGRRTSDTGQKERYCKVCGTGLGNLGPPRPYRVQFSGEQDYQPAVGHLVFPSKSNVSNPAGSEPQVVAAGADALIQGGIMSPEQLAAFKRANPDLRPAFDAISDWFAPRRGPDYLDFKEILAKHPKIEAWQLAAAAALLVGAGILRQAFEVRDKKSARRGAKRFETIDQIPKMVEDTEGMDIDSDLAEIIPVYEGAGK